MFTETNSSEIIFECLKEHGKGQLFFRTDGLEFEQRREAARRDFLNSHPAISPEHRAAILKGAATPGMTRDEVTAGWGLLEEDTRMVFGNVTEDRLNAYALFTGFAIGQLHALYLRDNLVIGIQQTDELVQPHEEELAMRWAEENQGVYFFYTGGDDRIRGSDVDQFHIDWDTLHLHLYRVELVPLLSDLDIGGKLKAKGLAREYEIALLRLGYDSRTAPLELRSRVALSLLPYHAHVRGTEPAAFAAPQTLPRSEVIQLPSSSLLPDPAALFPPEEWQAYFAGGRQAEAAFPSIDGGVELLRVEWKRERVFRVDQVPLRVNGVSLHDLVELEWSEGEITPRFKRLSENCVHRTIRAVANDSEGEAAIRHFAKVSLDDAKKYRYEKGVLAFTIAAPELDEISKEWLGYLPVTWMYTDTLTQD